MKKKLLTSLLIGLTLNGVVSSTVFALDNSNTNHSTSKYTSISDLLPTATSQTGKQYINGQHYEFDENGVLLRVY